MVEIVLYTDVTVVALADSLLSAKESIKTRLRIREQEFLPSICKDLNVFREGDDVILSQMGYLYTMDKENDVLEPELDKHCTTSPRTPNSSNTEMPPTFFPELGYVRLLN